MKKPSKHSSKSKANGFKKRYRLNLDGNSDSSSDFNLEALIEDGCGDDLDNKNPSPLIDIHADTDEGVFTEPENTVSKKKKGKNKKGKKKVKQQKGTSGCRGKKPPLKRTTKIGHNTLASFDDADDKAVQSLWQCHSIEDVTAVHEKWGTRFNAKCMAGTKTRKLAEDIRDKIEALLNWSATDVPILTNNRILAIAWQDMQRKIVAQTKDDHDVEFILVTYIAGDGGTSLNHPIIEMYHSRELVLKVSRSISNNFIGTTELAMFNSHDHADGGRHVQRHEHVLLWGHGIVAKAQEVAARRMKEFSPNNTGAPQIVVRRVAKTHLNLARICAYLFKSPHKAMNWNPPQGDKKGHMNQSEKGDRYICYLRMAQIRSMMTVEDIMFAGGEGIAIRSELIKLLRQTCRSNVPFQTRLLHPDEIGAFWVEVNKELKKHLWRLPVIARRP